MLSTEPYNIKFCCCNRFLLTSCSFKPENYSKPYPEFPRQVVIKQACFSTSPNKIKDVVSISITRGRRLKTTFFIKRSELPEIINGLKHFNTLSVPSMVGVGLTFLLILTNENCSMAARA